MPSEGRARVLSSDGLSLRAPIAVPIEVRAPSGRVFRLARNAGEDGVRLERPVPFEPGRTVDVRMVLPDAPSGADGGDGVLHLRARLMVDDDERAVELAFLDPPQAARAALHSYVIARLGLPGSVPGS
jgi:hypothetical protein